MAKLGEDIPAAVILAVVAVSSGANGMKNPGNADHRESGIPIGYWGCSDLFSDGSVCSCSISAAGLLKFLLRCRTLSVRRYSIWPLIERKSSSAQTANAFQSVGDKRSKSCFLSFSSFFSVITSKLNRCSQLAAHLCRCKAQQA